MDVGFSMSNSAPGEEPSFELAKKVVQKCVQRQVRPFQNVGKTDNLQSLQMDILPLQVFAETKDELALVLFGTDGTKNSLDRDNQYQNITVHRKLMIPDFQLLDEIANQIHPETQQADCILFKPRLDDSYYIYSFNSSALVYLVFYIVINYGYSSSHRL